MLIFYIYLHFKLYFITFDIYFKFYFYIYDQYRIMKCGNKTCAHSREDRVFYPNIQITLWLRTHSSLISTEGPRLSFVS